MQANHSNHNQKNKITKQLIKEGVYFVTLVIAIYICYITSAIFHEKLLKHQYKNNKTGQKSYFKQSIAFTFFPPLMATIIGFSILTFFPEKMTPQQSLKKIYIPPKNSLICGAIINFNMFTYNQAVVQASFPAVVMVKSCSLLSVILVGVFCSRVKDKKLKIGKNKIIIGILACLGIFMFNYFKKVQIDSVDQPIKLLSSLLLIGSLIGDGFLPDFQAQIKSEYKPTPIQMYYQINKYTFLVALLFLIITLRIESLIEFIFNHDQILQDIFCLSFLNSIGQIIIYKMIKLYKQHIPAFVIGVRKCLTVVINIIYFGHSINFNQFLAIIFVFFSIMWQTYENYLEKQKSLNQTQTSQIQKINKNLNIPCTDSIYQENEEGKLIGNNYEIEQLISQNIPVNSSNIIKNQQSEIQE